MDFKATAREALRSIGWWPSLAPSVQDPMVTTVADFARRAVEAERDAIEADARSRAFREVLDHDAGDCEISEDQE